MLRAGQNGKNVILSPAQYLLAGIIVTNPLLSLVWIAGLVWCLRTPTLRFLGYGYLILLVLMIASHAKHYYPADVYPILFAAGGVAIEAWTARAAYLRPVAVSLVLLAGLFMLPYAEPILPKRRSFDSTRPWAKLGFGVTVTEHLKQTWMTQGCGRTCTAGRTRGQRRRVYDSLPPDRAHAVASLKTTVMPAP